MVICYHGLILRNGLEAARLLAGHLAVAVENRLIALRLVAHGLIVAKQRLLRL